MLCVCVFPLRLPCRWPTTPSCELTGHARWWQHNPPHTVMCPLMYLKCIRHCKLTSCAQLVGFVLCASLLTAVFTLSCDSFTACSTLLPYPGDVMDRKMGKAQVT